MNSLGRKALTAAWMSIVLGLVLQGVLLLVTWRWPASVVADLMGRITWSVLVCTALVVGSVAAQAQSGLVGLVGLLAAPAAFAVARLVQKGLVAWLGALTAVASALPPGPFELALAKGVEYGLFGLAMTALRERRGSFGRHVLVGGLIGLMMAGYLALRGTAGGPVADWTPLIGAAVNELLFPVGCATVLWATVAAPEYVSERARPRANPA